MKPEDAFASLGGAWDLKTQPQGNWFVPQDAKLAPRSGLLNTARDYIYGTEPGRKMMSAVDMWNSLTGGAKGVFGNVAPSAEMAVSPSFEELLQLGHKAHGMESLYSKVFGKNEP